MIRTHTRGLLRLLLVSLAGCGGTESPIETTEPPTPVATTLTLSETALSFSSLGGTEQLTATVRDQTGATMGGASVTWASSASSVVGVSSTGLVTALAQGTATITATSGSASGTASVTVQQVATAVAKVSGGDQVGVVGVALYDSLAVIVNDSGGNAVEGALVQWNIAGGGGSLPPETRTNREGIARAQWRLGPTPVAQAATAALPGVGSLEFASSAEPRADGVLIGNATEEASRNETEGVPTDRWFLPPEGALRAVVLFVDFSDANGSVSTQSIYDALIGEALDWFEEASTGRVRIEVDAVNTWIRMPRSAAEYDWPSINRLTHHEYMADAVTTADQLVDFGQYDLVYVVSAPSSGFRNSPAFIARLGDEVGIPVDGTRVRWGATFGNDGQRPDTGWKVFMHETLHTFGLPDLYVYGASTSDELFRYAGAWDPMSSVWQGTHLTAWHKWKLGWLTEEEVVFLSRGGLEVELVPLATPGGLKAVVIRPDSETAYVLEARTRTGFDAGLCDEGVLFYSVDGRIPRGQGPIRVVAAGSDDPTSQCGALSNAPFDIGTGEVSRFRDDALGIEFEVISRSATAFRVRVRAWTPG